jgi:4-oxalocrotonate tautomerase family enzyme
MPVVTIDWFGGRTSEQKAAIATQMTKTMVEEGNVKPEDVWIRFVDTPKTHWAIDGKLQG